MLLPVVATPAYARTWQVDYAQSTLGFTGTCRAAACTGQFRRFTANIVYDPADVTHSRFDVRVDIASLDTGSGARDRVVLGSGFFDAAKFPRAYFVTTSFHRATDGRVTADGELELRGMIRPVVLDVAFVPHGGTATLDVTGQVRRVAFGIGSRLWPDSAVIANDVTVRGHLLLRRASAHSNGGTEHA